MWLQQHLEEFVKPVLGYVPNKANVNYFSALEKTLIKNIWRNVKKQAEGKLLVLPGRDVYVWEVLAHRENFPTYFLPACSRMTAHFMRLPTTDCFLFDTGFVGSIPQALKIDSFALMSYAHNRINRHKQVFTRMSGARHLALKIESTPKYWQSGRMVDGAIVQELAHEAEFLKAAQLTMEIYTDSSRKFEHKPLKEKVFYYDF